MDNSEARRAEALRRVADEGREWDSPDSRTEHKGARRFAMRILFSICLVAVIVGTSLFVFVKRSSSSHPRTRSESALSPDHSAGLGCASAPAWSPDGRLFAVLGTQESCAAIRSAPDATQAIYIFDGTTGHLARILKLEPLLQPQFQSVQFYGGCRTSLLSLCYDHMVWTPDGQRLAVLLTTPQSDPTVASYALLVVESHGTDAQIIKGGAFKQPAKTPPVVWALWNLQARTVRYAQEPDAFNTASQLTWGSDGSLTPAVSAPRGTSGTPVGNPAGGSAAFSPWQPGNILLEGGPLLSSSYWAWSPDGGYLATGLSTQIIIGNDTATPTPDASLGYGTASPRDEGLTTVLAQVHAQPITGEAEFGVAWTASGDNLAVLRCTNAPTAATLSIWNTRSGALIVTVPIMLSQEDGVCTSLSLDMSWSPDEHRLAIVSPTTGGVMVATPRLP